MGAAWLMVGIVIGAGGIVGVGAIVMVVLDRWESPPVAGRRGLLILGPTIDAAADAGPAPDDDTGPPTQPMELPATGADVVAGGPQPRRHRRAGSAPAATNPPRAVPGQTPRPGARTP